MTPSPVITGSGLVSALGLTRECTWQRVRAGESGLGPLRALEQRPQTPKGGGEAPPLDDDENDTRPREVRYLRRALADALQDAHLDPRSLPYDPARCGLVFGTTLHGMRAGGRMWREQSFDPLHDFQASAILQQAAGDLGLTGLAMTNCAACSSGLSSIGLGATLLATGQLDMVIAGGYDPISEYAYAGFDSLRLVATTVPRPFCREREGMKLGEGYGVVILERADDAQKRRAPQLWRILGFGETSDAHHLTQPHPEGHGAARAMRCALDNAQLTPADIGLISAHGTGTPSNERGESSALHCVFHDILPRIPIVAFKSQLGHTLGGAGAVELILTLCAMRDGVVPPTAHVSPDQLEYPDLHFAQTAEPATIHATLSVSIGFGGANACLILAPPTPRSDAAPPRTDPQTTTNAPNILTRTDAPHDRDVLITGVGIALPHAFGNDAFAQRMRDHTPSPLTTPPPPIDEALITDLLRTPRVRRMSDYVKLSLAVTHMACADAQLEEKHLGEHTAAMLGTTHGSAAYCADYYRQIVEQGIEAANPMLFAEGVPNAGAAHTSLMLGLTGPCQTIIGSRTAGLDALRLAALRIAAGQWQRAIVSTAEEATGLIRQAYQHCGLHANENEPGGAPYTPASFVLGSGAAALVLESRAAAAQRNAMPLARIRAAASAFHQSDELRSALTQWQRLYRDLGAPRQVIGGANSTWLSRIEAAALGALQTEGEPITVTSMYGHIAETFSVTPLAALIATLLTGRLPALHGEPPAGDHLQPATATTTAQNFALITADYNGTLAGVRIERCT
ncbi:MAG: beta-ketoacyl-[acyl-carrier-protein] synthase family protein [Phycisphaeraceae bacterium]